MDLPCSALEQLSRASDAMASVGKPYPPVDRLFNGWILNVCKLSGQRNTVADAPVYSWQRCCVTATFERLIVRLLCVASTVTLPRSITAHKPAEQAPAISNRWSQADSVCAVDNRSLHTRCVFYWKEAHRTEAAKDMNCVGCLSGKFRLHIKSGYETLKQSLVDLFASLDELFHSHRLQILHFLIHEQETKYLRQLQLRRQVYHIAEW
jgi:hypothetical protein